jgi:hypothetical protein
MMKKKLIIDKLLNKDVAYQQGVSVDCVVFGFHDRTLKVLLNKFSFYEKWMLPVGFIMRDEDMDQAAYRALKKKTGLKDIYLYQFHVFGNADRPKSQDHRNILTKMGVNDEYQWITQRFISIGYYALVEYSEVNIRANVNEDIRWFNLNEIPSLYSDHNSIIDKALSTIRSQIDIIPVGYKLLPEKFTLTELRIIYETLLGQQLDRRNFQRKIFTAGYVVKLNEIQRKPGLKPTTLFSFDKEKCEAALLNLIGN